MVYIYMNRKQDLHLNDIFLEAHNQIIDVRSIKPINYTGVQGSACCLYQHDIRE